MLLEIDEVALTPKQYEMMNSDNCDIKQNLADELSGTVLYMHNLTWDGPCHVVTLRELHGAGVYLAVRVEPL